MARSFLRGETWGKLFSAVDGCFILSPTAHFSSCWEKWAVGDTFSMQKCYWQKVTPRRQKQKPPAEAKKRPPAEAKKRPTKKQAGDPHPPVSHKLAQLNSLAMEIS